MTVNEVVEIMGPAIWTVIVVAAPPLLIGLAVGLVVSIFQTVTSIQEATLTFIPKIIAVFLGILLFGDFMLTNLTELMINMYSNFNQYLH